MANYDKIANYYDFLSRLIFFKSQVNAQISQLKYLDKGASILIVGGGTGWILDEISKIYHGGLKITYLEISEKMIVLSKNRDFGNNEVEFVRSAVESFNFTKQYDFILTPFLFDNFSREKAEIVFNHLNKQLKTEGKWFMVDFNLKGKKGFWWRKIILKLMYLFFGLLGIVEVSELIDLKPFFDSNNYKIIDEHYYYGNFIKSSIYARIL
ncbi:class I SAM-dependent methyltransferase [Pedobacter changchengzhani]|uniref:Class I SAM-dependent methyltransferase n=1 Tax=Pedobacter changchengzhani TaxID=2529274 RepID=A0A4R5MIK0_9SPHI|nr:class I SAM-dependent methyltransferase [Pedobacter changchengzhani]TDG34849.1 class I SAM-dependent methyltransferase [Pedobacter changchengzhani]